MKNKILLAISVIVIVILLIFTIIIIQKKNTEIELNGENEIQEQANQNIKNEIQKPTNEVISQANLNTSLNNSTNEVNKNQTSENNEEKIIIDTNEDLVHQLKCNFKDIITTFYKKQNISLENLDNQTKLKMILERVYNPYDEPEQEYITYNDNPNINYNEVEGEYITKTDFEKVAKRVFGEKVEYQDEDVAFSDIDAFTDTKLKFNEQKQRYDIIHPGTQVKAYAIPYIDKVYKYKDRVEMTIYEYYVEDVGNTINIYSDYDYNLNQFKNKIAQNISANYIYSGMEQIVEDGLIKIDNLSSYQMTFKLINNKYYFDKFEKLN